MMSIFMYRVQIYMWGEVLNVLKFSKFSLHIAEFCLENSTNTGTVACKFIHL